MNVREPISIRQQTLKLPYFLFNFYLDLNTSAYT